jgi:hypothetical protein
LKLKNDAGSKHKWDDKVLTLDEKKKVAKAPVIALFCSILDEVGVIRREENESAQGFCKRICDEYNLNFTVRVGKAFYTSKNKSNILKVKELILPTISKRESTLISEYLDKKTLPKQKLYV